MKYLVSLACCMALFSMSAANAAEKKKKSAHQPSAASKKKALIDDADENMSGQGYGTAGCGLGSIVFGQKTGMIQIVAATLNGTGYQTFGISTGTSNCKPNANDAGRTASLFITVNKEVLAKDISRGNGEALNNLSSIMGCKDTNLLGTKLQSNYGRIFPSENSSNTEKSSQEIFNIIKSDSSLSISCEKIAHV